MGSSSNQSICSFCNLNAVCYYCFAGSGHTCHVHLGGNLSTGIPVIIKFSSHYIYRPAAAAAAAAAVLLIRKGKGVNGQHFYSINKDIVEIVTKEFLIGDQEKLDDDIAMRAFGKPSKTVQIYHRVDVCIR